LWRLVAVENGSKTHLFDFSSAFELSHPYQVGFSPKARGFYPFGGATDLAGEGGVGDVVWLIQAPT